MQCNCDMDFAMRRVIYHLARKTFKDRGHTVDAGSIITATIRAVDGDLEWLLALVSSRAWRDAQDPISYLMGARRAHQKVLAGEGESDDYFYSETVKL